MIRILTQNVLLGGQDRLGRLCALMAATSPDVVVLQECLGWDQRRLEEVAHLLGLPHTCLGDARPRGSGARYHVAVVSRWPLTDVVVHADPAVQGHALIAATVRSPEPLRLLATHMDSHTEDLRLVEASFLTHQYADLRGRHVLAGDLNALSPHDPYPADLGDRLLAAGTEKYGHPPRFDVMRLLERAGWRDPLLQRAPGEPWATSPRDRGGVHIDARTDYVLVSPDLLPEVTDARMIDVGDASDHHGLQVTLRG